LKKNTFFFIWSRHWHAGCMRTVFVQPKNTFGMPYNAQSYKYIVLATKPWQVTHHYNPG